MFGAQGSMSPGSLLYLQVLFLINLRGNHNLFVFCFFHDDSLIILKDQTTN